MIFGWQGFELQLPEDFAPVALTGNAAEGYARLLGERDSAFQIRWLPLRPGASLEATVRAYLLRLQKDARRAKRNFSFSLDDGRYRISGETSAWGSWFSGANRGYILEVSGKSAALPVLRTGLDTFHEATGTWTWEVNGLALHLPSEFKLERFTFFAGKTELEFRRGRSLGKLVGQRWGFASRLLSGRTASEWATNVLGWKRPSITEEAYGPRLRAGGREALVFFDEAADRLTLLFGPSRRIEWSPRWEWIVLENGSSEAAASRLSASGVALS